ncbi:hypothetical protein BX616_004759, partial [Lobosporangium transversale]
RRPRRNRSSSKDVEGDPGDRYIPNYERDGYNPAPRYSRPDHFNSRYDSPGGYGDYRGPRRRDDGYGDIDGPDPMPYGEMPPNWGNADRIDDPMKLDHLISFKQYCEYLRNLDRASHRYKRYSDEELQSRYGTYKEEFTAKQYAAFFDVHKTEAWFQEKYHPDLSKSRAEEAQTLRRARYNKFVEDLAAGKYDNTTCDEAAAKKANAASAEAKTEKSETDGEASESVDKDGDVKLASEDSEEPWLYLRAILPNVTRSSILERCEKIEGFVMLSLSEPHPLKELQRIGWIKFKPGTDVQEALTTISEPATEDFQVSTTAHRPTRARYTHEIANTEARIHADYELALEIAKVCDRNLMESAEADSGVAVYDGVSLLQARLKDMILESSDVPMEEGEEDSAQTAINRANERRSLDLFIEYLRQVHFFCYYCGGDSDNAEEFTRKCSKHYRNPETKITNSKGAIWVKNLEQKLNLKLKPPTDEEIVKLGGKSLEKGVLKFLQGKTQQDEPTKWRCKICTKPFRGEEFVHKHIRTKHPEEIKSVENNIQLFNNYILDPNHINPSAQQQQPQPSAGFGFNMPGPMYGGPPMQMGFMSGGHPMGMPFMNPGVSPMPGFPPGFMPPSFATAGAMAGSPMDQIPRIGFDLPKRGGSKDDAGDKSKLRGPDLIPARPPSMMLDPRSRMSDPRKVKSYVDLDAPAEGDLDSKYNL